MRKTWFIGVTNKSMTTWMRSPFWGSRSKISILRSVVSRRASQTLIRASRICTFSSQPYKRRWEMSSNILRTWTTSYSRLGCNWSGRGSDARLLRLISMLRMPEILLCVASWQTQTTKWIVGSKTSATWSSRFRRSKTRWVPNMPPSPETLNHWNVPMRISEWAKSKQVMHSMPVTMSLTQRMWWTESFNHMLQHFSKKWAIKRVWSSSWKKRTSVLLTFWTLTSMIKHRTTRKQFYPSSQAVAVIIRGTYSPTRWLI